MGLLQFAGTCVFLAARAAAQGDFTSEIQSILSRTVFDNSSIGIMIRELESGDLVYSQNEHLSLVPASNHKLVTSSGALVTLGADFSYNTTVLATAEPDADGTLDGDIWLVGSGDPSLTSARLTDVAEALAEEHGLTEITGSVYGDGSVFDTQLLGSGWSWGDEAFSYSPQVAGLNCDLNVVNVTVSPGSSAGDAAVVAVNGLPLDDEEYVEVRSSVNTVAESGDPEVVFDRRRGRNVIVLTGSVSAGADPVNLTVTIEEPAAYAAYRFAHALKDAGVEVSTSPADSDDDSSAPDGATQLASSASASLSEIIRDFMKPSDNLYGEALLKTVAAAEDSSSPGSSAAGAVVVTDYFDDAGIATSGVVAVDGSGLSRMDSLTAQFVSDLLFHVSESFSDEDNEIFVGSLPVGGVDGTLSDRFVGTPVEGKVRAKTGSLTGVSALSGYLEAQDGTEYVFAMLMNHIPSATEARQGQDDIVEALYNR